MSGYEITFFIILGTALFIFLAVATFDIQCADGTATLPVFLILMVVILTIAWGIEIPSQKYDSQTEISSESLKIISKTEVPEGISVLFSLNGETEQQIFKKYSDVKMLLNGGALYSVDYFNFNAFGPDYSENKIEVRQPPVVASEYFLIEDINGLEEEPNKRDGEDHWSLQEDFFRNSENTWKVESHDLILNGSESTQK